MNIQFKHIAYFMWYVVFSFHPNRFTKFSFEGLNDGKILKSVYMYTVNVIESDIYYIYRFSWGGSSSAYLGIKITN